MILAFIHGASVSQFNPGVKFKVALILALVYDGPMTIKKYRKKPVVIEAGQWHEQGEHSEVETYCTPGSHPNKNCEKCNKPMHLHGWIDTLEGGHIVCPGDWIIKGIQGEYYPIKDDIFRKTYDPVD